LGVYTIQVSQFVFRTEPTSIKATGTLNDEGVDVETEVEMKYSNGGVARFKTSGLQECHNKAIVRGSKASITVSKTNEGHQFSIYFSNLVIFANRPSLFSA
jgi:predicted dehydrogenase